MIDVANKTIDSNCAIPLSCDDVKVENKTISFVRDVEVAPFSPVYEDPYTWVDARSTTNIKNDVPPLEEPHSWEDDKCLGFKNEVYSLVVASDMEDWFHEDVSLHCFPD